MGNLFSGLFGKKKPRRYQPSQSLPGKSKDVPEPSYIYHENIKLIEKLIRINKKTTRDYNTYNKLESILKPWFDNVQQRSSFRAEMGDSRSGQERVHLYLSDGKDFYKNSLGRDQDQIISKQLKDIEAILEPYDFFQKEEASRGTGYSGGTEPIVLGLSALGIDKETICMIVIILVIGIFICVVVSKFKLSIHRGRFRILPRRRRRRRYGGFL